MYSARLGSAFPRVPPPHGKPPHSSRTILRPMRWRHGRRRRCSTRALARRHSSVRIVVVILPSTIATGGCWRTPSARMISSCGTSADQAQVRHCRSNRRQYRERARSHRTRSRAPHWDRFFRRTGTTNGTNQIDSMKTQIFSTWIQGSSPEIRIPTGPGTAAW